MPCPRQSSISLVLTLALVSCTCAPSPSRTAPPRLPAGEAGKVLAQALDAAGGWARWQVRQDVGFVSTLTLLDSAGEISSQSIGWYTAPLHRGMKARMESIGLASEVVLGASDDDTWIVRDGVPVEEPQRVELTRFNLVSNLFWFSLPFVVAEMPATVTDVGDAAGDDTVTWHRLKVVFEPGNPLVPGEWFVLYINAKTGLIDRVHTRIRASFLRQELWVGKWVDYRDCDGMKKERRRKFYPADDNGEIIGDEIADQLVEHVRFNNGYPLVRFQKPPRAGGAKAVGGPRVFAPPFRWIALPWSVD